MDGMIYSQPNRATDCVEDFSNKSIPALIRDLKDPDNFVRMHARDVLSCIGALAVPDLLKTLLAADTQLRWQIIKIFDTIQDPETIPILMDQLKNENAEIRWAASNALINQRRAVVPPLLEALTHDFSSIWLRQSAHHILRVLRDNGKLTTMEEKVYEALEDIEPSVSVPWAAEKALEALRYERNDLLQD